MRVLFVVEAGFKAGLGHLLRSRALLLELQARGHHVDLWLHGDPAALDEMDWPEGMGRFHSGESEPVSKVSSRIVRISGINGYDWLIVDGYAFSERPICRQFTEHGAKLLIIDDLGSSELEADMVLNQNTDQESIYTGSRILAERFLLGPQYALVDHVYTAARTVSRSHGELRRLLVTFGGVDRHGRTQRVLELVSRRTEPLDIVVVVGPYYPYVDILEAWRGRHILKVLRNVCDLVEPMQWCDLMITAGGSTVWQACCLGVPMLVLQTVDNQKWVVEMLRRADAALSLDVSARPDEGAGIGEEAFCDLFRQAAVAETRTGLSEHAWKLVDGNGAGRVAAALESWRRVH